MVKKYLLVLPSFNIGGAEKQALSFAIYLKSKKRDVTIISNVKRGPICDGCEKNEIKWISIETPNWAEYKVLRCLELVCLLPKTIKPYNDAMSMKLARYIKREKFEYCIAYCSNSGVWLGKAAKYCRAGKYIWYQRDAGIFNSGDDYEKSALLLCNYVLANSLSGKKYIEDTFRIPTTIIENGVKQQKPALSAKEWRDKLRVTKDDVICTMVANLHSAKDHLSVLNIWNRLKNDCYSTIPILVLAGRFDDKYQELLDYVNTHGLSENVRFLGSISDVPGLLSVTDICVFGAKSEGSPNGIIEATLMSLPVFATNLPEIREVVSDRNIPFLFNKGDIADGVEKLKELLDNKNLRDVIGQDNKNKSLFKYDETLNFEKIIKLLEE